MTPSLPRLAATGLLVALVLAATNMFLVALPSVEPTLTGVAAPVAYFAPAPPTSALMPPADSQPVVATVDPPQTARAAMRATTGWVHPLPGTCRPPYGGGQFGAPRDGGTRSHAGADLGGREGLPVGTPVRAAAAGTVVAAGWSGGAGLRVNVDHGGGITTHSQHFSSIDVRVGQHVAAGQRLGGMGNTGHSFGVHVHFEVRINGVAVNPVPFLADRGVEVAC